MCGAGRVLAAVLVPCGPLPWFATKAGKQGGGWGRMELPVRKGPHWPLWPQARPQATTLGAVCASKGEVDMALDTCTRRSLTSVQTRSRVVNGNLPSASSHCPVLLLLCAGLTRQHGRGSIDGCSCLSDRSLTHTRGSPASRWRSFFCEWYGSSEAVCACLAALQNRVGQN